MKFSDSVVLGLSIINFNPNIYLNDGCGCLIGAAYSADTGVRNEEYRQVVNRYPWLKQYFEIPEIVAQSRYRIPVFGEEVSKDKKQGSANYIISNFAAMIKDGAATLDQAIAWIKANEPQETTPTVNETDCVLLAC
jgi:hypothetical protein